MTKYAVAVLAVLFCSHAASAQHFVESYRVVSKPHKHRVVTRTVAPTYYAPTHYAPTYYAPAPVKQTYNYEVPGAKVRAKVNKQGEVRVREVYQNPWGGKQKVKYRSNPVQVYSQPVIYYGY